MENKKSILEDFENILINSNKNITYKDINQFNEKYNNNFEYLNLIKSSNLSTISNNEIINNLDTVKNYSKYNCEIDYLNKISIDKEIELNQYETETIIKF